MTKFEEPKYLIAKECRGIGKEEGDHYCDELGTDYEKLLERGYITPNPLWSHGSPSPAPCEPKPKGEIRLQVADVWELTNKPHRFFIDILKQVEEMPLGKYEYLTLDEKEKKDILWALRYYRDLGR